MIYDTQKAITAARACIGTPFVAQGRLPQAGLDCAGLVIHALRTGGLSPTDHHGYTLPPQPYDIFRTLAESQLVQVETISPGAVLLFRFHGQAQHLALACDGHNMIHAFAPVGRVVETSIGATWMPRLLHIYSYRETD